EEARKELEGAKEKESLISENGGQKKS
ncbi:MAG: hypothetical protein K0S32_4392, partial [Bacteroidetes bacterium]|nr:hypothetical protein [Bacteroidota bacterium]